MRRSASATSTSPPTRRGAARSAARSTSGASMPAGPTARWSARRRRTSRRALDDGSAAAVLDEAEDFLNAIGASVMADVQAEQVQRGQALQGLAAPLPSRDGVAARSSAHGRESDVPIRPDGVSWTTTDRAVPAVRPRRGRSWSTLPRRARPARRVPSARSDRRPARRCGCARRWPGSATRRRTAPAVRPSSRRIGRVDAGLPCGSPRQLTAARARRRRGRRARRHRPRRAHGGAVAVLRLPGEPAIDDVEAVVRVDRPGRAGDRGSRDAATERLLGVGDVAAVSVARTRTSTRRRR